MVELLSLIPEAGSAIAVIVVVILFLKYLQQSSAAMDAATHEFTSNFKLQRDAALKTVGEVLARLSAMDATAQETNTVLFNLRRIISKGHEDQ